MAQRGRPRHPELLTPREQEVLQHIRDGLTNEEIADRLGVSFNTAKTHVATILSKLGVSTREEAAIWSLDEDGGHQRLMRGFLLFGATAASAVAAISILVLAIGVLAASNGDSEDLDAVLAAEFPSATPTTEDSSEGTFKLWPTEWRLTAEPSGSRLDIEFAGGDGCDSFERFDVRENHQVVVLDVIIRRTLSPPLTVCTLALKVPRHTVELNAPLGDRQLFGCDPLPDNDYLDFLEYLGECVNGRATAP